MIVRFGSTTTKNGFLPRETAQESLSIEWNGESDKLYTVIFYDMDAPYPTPNNTKSPLLHYLITNIKGSDISTGNQLIDYIPPSPPSDSLPHNYFIDVYVQQGHIRPIQHTVREKFNVNKFIKDHNLTLVDRNNFQVGSRILTAKSASAILSVPSISSVSTGSDMVPTTSNYFKSDSYLNDKQKAWCRCVLHVADKQRGACNTEQAWFEKRNGIECYNPYAVCSKSVGTSVKTCGDNYDFNSISDNELITYAQLHQTKEPKIEIPSPYDRSMMLNNIKIWKEKLGKK